MTETLMAFLLAEPEWLWGVFTEHGVTDNVTYMGTSPGDSVYTIARTPDEVRKVRAALTEAHGRMFISTLPG